jgi:hypothetical protein
VDEGLVGVKGGDGEVLEGEVVRGGDGDEKARKEKPEEIGTVWSVIWRDRHRAEGREMGAGTGSGNNVL